MLRSLACSMGESWKPSPTSSALKSVPSDGMLAKSASLRPYELFVEVADDAKEEGPTDVEAVVVVS